MLEFGDVAFGMANDGQSGIAPLACMCADDFSGLAAFAQKLSTLHPSLYATYPHRLALGADHGHAVAGFQRVRFLLGVNSLEHEQMFAAFHRLHVLGGVGMERQCENGTGETAFNDVYFHCYVLL